MSSFRDRASRARDWSQRDMGGDGWVTPQNIMTSVCCCLCVCVIVGLIIALVMEQNKNACDEDTNCPTCTTPDCPACPNCSNVPFRVKDNFDIAGSDLPNMPINNVGSVEECAEKCAQKGSDCDSFAYAKQNGDCYLKKFPFYTVRGTVTSGLNVAGWDSVDPQA